MVGDGLVLFEPTCSIASARQWWGLARIFDMTTGADILAKTLREAGATRAFGIPGGEVLALVAALERAGIRFVLAKHENSAGFMAEGYWHVSGALPVLVATLGPGVANAVNVVANAMQDRVPLIFITGCVDAELAESYTHQVFDHQAVLRTIVKASFRATPETQALVVAKAVAIARAGRPGPVHIDLPISVAEMTVERREQPRRAQTPVAATRDLSEAIKLLATARRPLIIAGLDIMIEGSGPELAELVRQIDAPLLTTYKAKGVVPEDANACMGAVGLSSKADAIVRRLIDAADAIVLAGYDPIEMRQGWRQPWTADKVVIDLVAQAMPHGMHDATLVVEGHVGSSLRALTEGLSSRRSWPDGEPAQVRAAMRQAFATGDTWGPGAVFGALRAVAPRTTIATADSGAHRILLSQMWDCYAPRTLLQSSGLCTMGCALPLAIGAAMAADEPVICFVGDAGLEMVLGELATARDLRAPVIVAVLVDASLALIELKQRQSQLANAGVDFGVTDFAAVARAMGGHGVTIDNREQLMAETRDAFSRPGFTVLACRIPRRAYDGMF